MKKILPRLWEASSGRSLSPNKPILAASQILRFVWRDHYTAGRLINKRQQHFRVLLEKFLIRLLYVNLKIIGPIVIIEDYIKSELGLDGSVSAYTVSLARKLFIVRNCLPECQAKPTQMGLPVRGRWIGPTLSLINCLPTDIIGALY
jgi:hypothetical protein